MPEDRIELSLLSALSEIFAELATLSSVSSFAFRERFGRGANLDIETLAEGGKETVSINVYPALTDQSIVLQVDDRLYELGESLDDLSSEVRNILRGTSKLRQKLPHEGVVSPPATCAVFG